MINVGGLRIAALSGIYKANDYERGLWGFFVATACGVVDMLDLLSHDRSLRTCAVLGQRSHIGLSCAQLRSLPTLSGAVLCLMTC